MKQFIRRYNTKNLYGHRLPLPHYVADYSPIELENRQKNANLLRYAENVRRHGHRAATLDPLELFERDEIAAISPARYGLKDDDMYDTTGIFPAFNGERRTMADIRKHMESTYAGNLTMESYHVPSKAERMFLEKLFESGEEIDMDPVHIGSILGKSEDLDVFLGKKFPLLKRYGCEGAETWLCAIDRLAFEARKGGVEKVMIGMPHRGRLNLLTVLLGLPLRNLFNKIRGGSEVPLKLKGIEGDVLSHLTAKHDVHGVKVQVVENPSHLEAVNPVVAGRVRALQANRQKELQDFENGRPSQKKCNIGDKVLCVQIHGDAAFTGQGIVAETLGLAGLPHYNIGGSIHIIVNNSIGFTTPASSGRSTQYCTDLVKGFGTPIIHVNGDDPASVCKAIAIAFAYRQAFKRDICLDIMLFRKHGHNELDEPSFTQAQMTRAIQASTSIPSKFIACLSDDNQIAVAESRSKWQKQLEIELSMADEAVPNVQHGTGKWSGYVWPSSNEAKRDLDTGITNETFSEEGMRSIKVPDGFKLHSRLQRHVGSRTKSLETGKNIDFGTAEALAWGALLREGFDVRISGQDVGRGTFSHRHAMLVDQETEAAIIPLNLINNPRDGVLEIANSNLSEFATLGFEYGKSIESPRSLHIWEAQFGDFHNGAQIIIDNFIASGLAKWARQSGLVISLPTAMEGGGPEHSSARIERWLALTSDPIERSSDISFQCNMDVVQPTTPAQYFHLLRRQALRNFRVPLIIGAPKGILRLSAASSMREDFLSGTKFRSVIDDDSVHSKESVEQIVMCSGKIYYDLNPLKPQNSALIRLEELAPFPWQSVAEILSSYPNAKVRWVQEEPRNQGPYPHVAVRLNNLLRESSRDRLEYVGREENSVTATGIGNVHKSEKETLLKTAFEK